MQPLRVAGVPDEPLQPRDLTLQGGGARRLRRSEGDLPPPARQTTFGDPVFPAHLRRPPLAADHVPHRGEPELATGCSASRHRNPSVRRLGRRRFGKVDVRGGSLLEVHSNDLLPN